MEEYIALHGLDILTTILGLLYIGLEYRVSIWLWLVGIIMPALDICLYWQHGLYGDAGMAVYYTLAAVYGYCVWQWGHGEKRVLPISHMPLRLYLPAAVFFLVAWGTTYYILVTWTNSTVPLLDAFTNALSFVGLWSLARKYVEQWLFWMAVDVVCAYLYVTKDIPFKAGLYALYTAIAVAGWFKWRQLMRQQGCDALPTPTRQAL